MLPRFTFTVEQVKSTLVALLSEGKGSDEMSMDAKAVAVVWAEMVQNQHDVVDSVLVSATVHHLIVTRGMP